MFLDNAIRDLTNIVVYTVLIAAMLPWFLVVLPVAAAVYVLLYVVFRVGIRRLQRFQLESMAPLLTHVDATVHGLSSVHAYQRVDHFQRRPVSCVLASIINTYWFSSFLPRCMECSRGIAMRILAVCPSVCPSVCQTRAL